MSDPGYHHGYPHLSNGVQVRLVWSLPGGRTAYNVLHGTVAGGFIASAAISEAIFTAIKGAAGWTSWKANVNSTYALAGVDLRDLRSPNLPIVASTSAASAGTGAGVALPPGDALCVTLRTGFAGRSYRGRVYLPGLDSTALAAGGVAAAGTVTNASAFVTAVQTALTASSITLAIGQFQRDAYDGPNGVHHDARGDNTVTVTSIVTRNNVIDHQRRRAGRS